MANIPLFHETQSEVFLALVRAINDLSLGQSLTRDDILQRFPRIDWSNVDRLEELINSIFTFDKDGYARTFISSPITYITPTEQLRWLKSLLLDPECDFLLSDELRIKLLQELVDVQPLIERNIINIIREQGDNTFHQETSGRLRIIWQAIGSQKQLSYTYITTSGKVFQDTAAPCRLEYDCAQHRIRLILWHARENRAIKLNINRFKELQIASEEYTSAIDKSFTDFLADNTAQVVLELRQKNNAVDRCFALLGSYHKQAIYDEENNIYRLVIQYYRFDETEILDYILSLGSAVTVVSPQALRSRVIERLQAQWQQAMKAD